MTESQDYFNSKPLLVFGAHPDDIEFGCGATVAVETRAGRNAHFVVTSRGEASSHGSPESRTAEAEKAAAILGATIEFIDLDGDAHLEIRAAHTIKLAEIIRRIRPATVLATSPVENQHPDHARLGQIVRDASRLARYGGLKELIHSEAHAIDQLFFYAVTPDSEAPDLATILIDVSDPKILATWTAAMEAHGSQALSRDYIDLQLSRAKLLGARAGVAYATALYTNEFMIFQSLSQTGRGARNF